MSVNLFNGSNSEVTKETDLRKSFNVYIVEIIYTSELAKVNLHPSFFLTCHDRVTTLGKNHKPLFCIKI